MELFARNLRRLRLAVGLSQEAAARQLGVSLITWNRWECQKAKPNLDVLQRIADVLQTTPADLFRETFEESH